MPDTQTQAAQWIMRTGVDDLDFHSPQHRSKLNLAIAELHQEAYPVKWISPTISGSRLFGFQFPDRSGVIEGYYSYIMVEPSGAGEDGMHYYAEVV